MTSSSSRLEARIPNDLHELVRQVAELQGRSITDFVSDSLRKAALIALEEATMLRLSVEDQQMFVRTLLNPPKPNAALRKAFAARVRLGGPE